MSSKRTRNSWDYDETRYFLQLVREQQISKSLDGKRFAVEDIFQHLEQPMANQGYFKTAKEMQCRFKTLRFVFNQHRKGLTVSGEANTKKKFPFFQEMSIILNSSASPASNIQEEAISDNQIKLLDFHVQGKKTNESSSSQTNTKFESFSFTPGEIQVINSLEVSEDYNTILDADSDIARLTETPSTNSLRDEPEIVKMEKLTNGRIRSSKKKKRSDSGERITALWTALINRQDSSKRVDEDEDVLYGKMIAQYLKKITFTRRKLEVKKKILSVILEYT